MGRVVLIIISVIFIIALLVIVVSTIANLQFSRTVDKEVKALFSNVENKHEVIQNKDLEGLPRPVQNWLKNSQVVGKEKSYAVRTKQEVTMRLKADQPWMKANVEQYFRTNEPGFIWAVDIKAAPLIHIVGKDKYIDGRGNMLIKVLSLLTVADGSGKEIDQGTLLRYLAETMWFPEAALNNYIQWEGVDSNSAKATMSYNGVTASGVFTFNENGEPISFVAKRYGDFDGEYRLETWACVMTDYQDFNGRKVPSQGDLIWKLNTGDFHWYHFEVKDIQYNELARYGA